MYLWIDPWIRKLWYALTTTDLQIIDAGIILQHQKSPSRMDQWVRMEQIYNFFLRILQEHTILHIGMEKLFFTSQNQSNAEFVYGIRGALAMQFSHYNIPLTEYTPNEIKKAVTWNGKANKEQVQLAVQKWFNLTEPPEPHDAADALGICWMLSNKLSS